MGRQNIAFLYARVSSIPNIAKDNESGEYQYGMVYVDTVRGLRSVEDGTRYPRHDNPLIIGGCLALSPNYNHCQRKGNSR